MPAGSLDRRGVLAIALLAAAPVRAVRAQAPGGPRIVAVVNDEVVTSTDMAQRTQLAIASAGLADTPEVRRRLAPQLLRLLIDERLQAQEAKRLRLAAQPAEIDREFALIAERNKLTPERLERTLRGLGVDPGALRGQIAAQASWRKVLEREVRPRVVVTREQIEYALQQGEGSAEELLLGEILLPVYTLEQEAQVLADARELLDSLAKGADFAALARQLSAARSASEGGDLGWVRLGALQPELRDALGALAAGQVSAPIRTPDGVRLFQVRQRRRPEAPTASAEREAAVQRRLWEEQLQRQADRYLRELRRRAFIDVRA